MIGQQGEQAGRSALVLYGTETGNAQDMAYEIGQSLERLHIATITRELDTTPLQDLLYHDLIVIAVSTTGQGDFPSNANKFWSSLRRKKLTATSLLGVNYALIGLCDSSYPKFNLAARKLHKRLQQLGADSICEPCEADEQAEDGTEGDFLAWLPSFQAEVLANFPLGSGQKPIPSDQHLPSHWTLVYSDKIPNLGNEANPKSNGVVTAKTSIASPELALWTTLDANERVTPKEHWQDVRMLKLRADRYVEYMPGDALAIRPENGQEDVNQLLNLLGWQEVADRRVQLQNNRSHSYADETFDPVFANVDNLTLRILLTQYLDVNAIPRRSFFAKIAHYTDDEMQKERALEFTDPQFLDEYFDYATRPRRSILEVLQEFDTLKIPWQEVINIFPILRPRQFSLASSGAADNGASVFELLIAIVKYRTVIKRIRQGVCTKYLARLPVGSRLNVVLHTEGRFHTSASDIDRPHLLIGGGTGIAPLRSIIHEKASATKQRGKSILIFGCRSAHSDYFFRDEWTSMQDDVDPALRVITAFSRDQTNKVYVQDRIRENGQAIRQFLADPRAMIIVCGSSGAMPKAVRQALQDVLSTHGPPAERQAGVEDIIVTLERSGRYKQETW